MSWQCPICETVNQDVTPVCTVCDNIAPVIESYLSLEAIDRLREYNEKLDVIHALESEEKYEEMLRESLAAIALYQENGLALEKVKQALMHIQQNKLQEHLHSYLDEAIDKREYRLASEIIKIADHFRLDDDEINACRAKIKLKISKIKEVDDYLTSSFKALMDLDTNLALQVVEEGMLKHTHSKRLKQRRNDIKKYIALIKEKENKKEVKHIPSSPRKTKLTGEVRSEKEGIIDHSNKSNKIPKITRK